MLFLLFLALSLPLSLVTWFFYVVLAGSEKNQCKNPTRWMVATIIPLVIVIRALKNKSISKSGAITGLFVAFILALSNYAFLGSLMCFFITSSKATKFRGHLKRKLEHDYKEGGQRNWIQVLCNGSVSMHLAVIYMIDYGCGEANINFEHDFRASWTSLAVLASFCCTNADTWASELGSVFKTNLPRLITTLKVVPAGTNGAVTIGGIVFSALGGLAVGLTYYLTNLSLVEESDFYLDPPQWPIIVYGILAGLFGSTLDSLLGATLQFSGIDKTTSTIVEHPGDDISPISGVPLMDNNSVNLLSSLLTAIIFPSIALNFWPQSSMPS